MQCRDGADILEGPLDDYSDCDAATRLCQKTRRCAAKCKARRRCRFYTTYRGGWCQLSSRCDDEAPASDRSAVTFARVLL